MAKEAAGAPDGVSALRTLSLLRDELDEFERRQAARALATGRSYSDVARALGISRQAAHRRFRDVAAGPAPEHQVRASAAVRRMIEEASAEARELGATGVEPRHLLLAIARCDARTAAALRSAGLTMADAREDAAAFTTTAGTRHVLARAVGLARRDRTEQVEVDHVLRAVLDILDRRRISASARQVLQLLDASLAEPVAGAAG